MKPMKIDLQSYSSDSEFDSQRAARLLCMKVTTLNAKLKRYGIGPHDSIGEVVSLSGIKEQHAYTAKSSNAD